MTNKEAILSYIEQQTQLRGEEVDTNQRNEVEDNNENDLSPEQKQALYVGAKAQLSLKLIGPKPALATTDNGLDVYENQRKEQEQLIETAKQLGLTPEQINKQEQELMFQVAERAYVQLVQLRKETHDFRLGITSSEDRERGFLLEDIVKLAKEMGFQEDDIKAKGNRTKEMQYQRDRESRIAQAKQAYTRFREIYEKTNHMAMETPDNMSEEEYRNLKKEYFDLKDEMRELTRLDYWNIKPKDIDPSLVNNKWPWE